VSEKVILKRDLSGKILFVVGLALIGFAVFNTFEDLITNQYYKIRRSIMNFSSSQITSGNPASIEKSPNIPEKTISESQTPESLDSNKEILELMMENSGEGFLPVSIEVSENINQTPEETKEYDVVPVRISIPVIDLTADIIQATHKEIIQGDKTYIQWLAPDEYAVGWHSDSAFLGVSGNTVLNGHHNVYGKVFENLDKLVSGDQIYLYGNDLQIYEYVVTNTMILPERDVTFEERLDNAKWILPSEDERITLITCWPYFSNTHRLIVVARPVGSEPVPITNERN